MDLRRRRDSQMYAPSSRREFDHLTTVLLSYRVPFRLRSTLRRLRRLRVAMIVWSITEQSIHTRSVLTSAKHARPSSIPAACATPTRRNSLSRVAKAATTIRKYVTICNTAPLSSGVTTACRGPSTYSPDRVASILKSSHLGFASTSRTKRRVRSEENRGSV